MKHPSRSQTGRGARDGWTLWASAVETMPPSSAGLRTRRTQHTLGALHVTSFWHERCVIEQCPEATEVHGQSRDMPCRRDHTSEAELEIPPANDESPLEPGPRPAQDSDPPRFRFFATLSELPKTSQERQAASDRHLHGSVCAFCVGRDRRNDSCRS